MSRVNEIANWEIFLWSLYQLGGNSQYIDIEDIFLECYRIASTHFGWRTRPDLPDYKKCAKALQEAERRLPKMLIKTSDSFGRQLTVEGQRWAEINSRRFSKILNSGVPVPEPKRRPSSRMITEIEASESFMLWKRTGTLPHEKWRMADVLRCSPDSSSKTWNARLESARGIAYSANNQNILRFFDEVYSAHPEWFGG